MLFKTTTESDSTEQKPNSSNEKKRIFNDCFTKAFNNSNQKIKIEIPTFEKIKKTNYKDNIDKGNDYYFNQYLEKRNIVVVYNFCSDYDKKRLKIIYVIGIIKSFNYLKDLEMIFGEFLCGKKFPFSDEYKKKHPNVKYEEGEEEKFPNSKIYLDKIGQKKKI